MPYICNHTALDLGLEGTPDPSLDVLLDAAAARNYTGYICPEVQAVLDAMDPEPLPAPAKTTTTTTPGSR